MADTDHADRQSGTDPAPRLTYRCPRCGGKWECAESEHLHCSDCLLDGRGLVALEPVGPA
jgi:hypothetical protein